MREFWLMRIVATAGFVLISSSSSSYTVLVVAAWTTCRTTTAPRTTSTRWRRKRTNEEDPSSCHSCCHTTAAGRQEARARQGRLLPVLYAKPPPTSSFNLQSIEAYELQLDREAEAAAAAANVEWRSGMEDDAHGQQYDDDEDDDDRLFIDDHDFLSLTVPPELDQKRMDAALSQLLLQELAGNVGGDDADLFQCSRSQCSHWITQGCVSVVLPTTMDADNININNNDDNLPIHPPTRTSMVVDRKSFRVEAGQELRIQKSWIRLRQNPGAAPMPQSIPLDILYEDQHLIVLNKAADMVVHPAAGNWDGTVVHALLYYLQHDSPYGPSECFGGAVPNDSNSKTDTAVSSSTPLSWLLQQQEQEHRPGIVHRLDKGTTGVLVVGKTLAAVAALSQQFANRTVEKTYLAIAVGNPGHAVVMEEPIGRHPVHRQRMRVVPPNGSSNTVVARRARHARSLVDTLAFDGKLSWVQVRIETGRTHQIRVHLQHHQTPIYGDDVYGRRDWNQQLEQRYNITRPLLHAYQLQLQHPATGQRMVFRAPMATDMQLVVQRIDGHAPEAWPDAFVGNSDNKL